MKETTWLNSLAALVLLIACVLGCSRAGADVRTPEASENKTETPHALVTAPPDINGDYSVIGTNENGSPYKGSLEVIKQGDVYQFRWDAGKQYDGVGVSNGNVIAVAFTEGSNGKGCGVVSYQVLENGSLNGYWAYWGVNEMGTEQATRTSGSGLAGDYNVTGKNPNGTGYRGQLSVSPQAAGYKFAWSNNSSGFGIRQGNNVSVGIGGPRCAFVAYEIKPNGELDGVWGGYGSDKTGMEKATKR